MPYVTQSRRDAIAKYDRSRTSGDLNFEITQLIIRYVKTKGLCYQTINDIRGATIGAQLEFERRIANPYEDRKIIENGDVYQDILPVLSKVGI